MSGLVVSNIYWRVVNSPSKFGVHPHSLLFPETLVDWMDENRLQGRFFNTYDTGGYLMWRRPDHLVFTDSRLVSNVVYSDYLAAFRNRGEWDRVANRYQLDGALMRKNDGGNEERLYNGLKSGSGWIHAYEDARWAFFLSEDYLERVTGRPPGKK